MVIAAMFRYTAALRGVARGCRVTPSIYLPRPALPILTPTRHYSTPPPAPKRPSPYRLVQPHAFLSAFAPLHVSGWRLDLLEPQERLINPQGVVDEALGGDGGDLQGRRLVRAFEMGEGKEGWNRVLEFVERVGRVIEEQDHHPTLLISPSSDYRPSAPSLTPTPQPSPHGYVVELSTHTHTPLPPYPEPTKGGTKMRPGVTGKDLKLAEKTEEVYGEVRGGLGVEVKRE
ncbi:hypothetical protein IAT38_005146 [Cryptococcus sp. DSM 104549]